MASGVTNRGKYLALNALGRDGYAGTTFYVALITDAVTPNVDINTFGELTEIADTNGYTSGGAVVNRNSTDFDVLTEDDTLNLAFIQIANVVWTASGGSIPASGSGARYAVLLTNEGTVANRQVLAWWDLGSARIVSDTQTLTLVDLELRAS